MKIYHALILFFVVFLSVSYYFGYSPIILGAFFFIASVITYLLYAKDKAAAKAGTWRVSEKSLHIAALLFGWPGALIAQERLRHKTQKRSFRAVFWLSVILNLGTVGWLHSPKGNAHFREAAHQIENAAISHVPYQTPVSTILVLTKFRAKEIEWPR